MLLTASLTAAAWAGTPSVKLGAFTVVVAGADDRLLLTTSRGQLHAVSLASGAEVWTRAEAGPIWLEGAEVLAVDPLHSATLKLTLLDARLGTVVRSCDVATGNDRPFAAGGEVSWSATVEGGGEGRVDVSWNREERYSTPERKPGSAPGVAAVMNTRGALNLDTRTCAVTPRVYAKAASAPLVHEVRPADEVTDAEGNRFPAFRWVEVDSAGLETRSTLLDAGYRTRAVPSADGAAFAMVYAEPDAARAMAWSVYDLATGSRVGRVTPKGVGDRFLVTGGLVLFELAGSAPGLVAYDLATGVERWRVTVGS